MAKWERVGEDWKAVDGLKLGERGFFVAFGSFDGFSSCLQTRFLDSVKSQKLLKR
jgi:hypothetical protein